MLGVQISHNATSCRSAGTSLRIPPCGSYRNAIKSSSNQGKL
ncbi:hypothetical protein Q7C_941 [Methylophaga frappieri]|uniref:Uncharacterized protein n=1 Tax=Methylophaga frappieri (strain ATCC BAA-2434 / DSM 25690 / JAM7) TaxID=754477 RepID=I1YGR7_METFJ|nr:hypothetical protein Q7C_941 [Methylophaga frappieri]